MHGDVVSYEKCFERISKRYNYLSYSSSWKSVPLHTDETVIFQKLQNSKYLIRKYSDYSLSSWSGTEI